MDTGSIVPTQSMQRIFSPILSQITELLIVTSENYETESGGDSINLLRPMVSMSEDIVESLKDLTSVCQQTFMLEYPEDYTAKQEVERGSQNLLVAGESLVLCCHILCSATKPNFQLKTPVPHQTDIAGCLSDVNQCMLLLLLSLDDAEIRKIASHAVSATDCLASLTAADTLQRLNDEFRNFAIPVANLHILASARCKDILDKDRQYKLRCSLAVLRQSLPMLTAALQLAIKYPDNDEVLRGRDYCVEQVRKSISDITKIITAKHAKKSLLDGGIGLFHEKLAEIKDVLSVEKRNELDVLSLHTSVESFCQHSMELPLVMLKSSSSMKIKANTVVRCCRKMMKSLRELESTLDNYSPEIKAQENLLRERCSTLKASGQVTMSANMTAVISLVTNVFKTMDEPMLDLMEACISPAAVEKDSLAKMREQKRIEEQKVTELSKIFSNHVSDIVMVSRFSAYCCKNPAVYQKYKKVLLNFDQASKAIVLSANEFFNNDKEENSDDVENGGLFGNDRIMDLKERWTITLGDLIQLIVASLELKELLDALTDQVIESIEKCTEAIVNMDENQLAAHLHQATGKSRFICRIANAFVSCNTDPVHRNSVLSHVKGLKHNIANTLASGNQLIEDIGQTERQELFSTHASNLLDSLKAVTEAILSQGNELDLTSSKRFNVRDDDTEFSKAVLKEMRALNEKLISLGFDPISDEEMDQSFPVPTSTEPGWPRYYYDEDQRAQMHHEFPQDIFPEYDSSLATSHPVMSHYIQYAADAFDRKNLRSPLFEKAKELVATSTEIMTTVARDILRESIVSNPSEEDRKSVKEESIHLITLQDLMFKETENQSVARSGKSLADDISPLASKWSKAVHIISFGCAKIIPLYTVPVRRYLALSINSENKGLAGSLVAYPGSPAKFLSKLALFKQDELESDKVSVGDFRVHEQNVKELIQLVDAFYELCNEDDGYTKNDDVIALCDDVTSDWSAACKTKAEILSLVNNLSLRDENPLDKSILQMHCLAWSAKIHSLHCAIFKLATVFHEKHGIKLEHTSLYELLFKDNKGGSIASKCYKEQISKHIKECEGMAHSLPAGRSALIATWIENLQVTSQVMEEILEHLSTVKSAVHSMHHHGHTMFHFVYLHHLFYMILSYLIIMIQQEHRDSESSTEKRPSLSARLKGLKEERERRDGSLHDLLRGIPKINTQD